MLPNQASGPANIVYGATGKPVSTNALGTANPVTATGKSTATGPVGAAGPVAAPLSKYGSSGWYLFGAITVSVALGNTPAGPILFGILTLALIYQTSLALEGK